MPWWAWVVAAGVVAVVLSWRWNPISRASAADTVGRRWWLLVHGWPIWRWVIALAVAAVAILIATHPGTPAATAPAKAAKPSPGRTAAPSPPPTPSPAASPAATATGTVPVAASPSQGHLSGPVFIVILIGLGLAATLAVWLTRDYWLPVRADYLDDTEHDNDTDDQDGWPTGSAPDPDTDDDDDTEDEHDGYQYGDWDTPSADEGPLVGERPAVVQHPGRGRWQRHPRIPRR